MKLGAALVLAALTACSATPGAHGPDEQGPEASAAIAAATSCVQTTEAGINNGFGLLLEKATARRDPDDAGRWIVAFPPGYYMGRLPPPGPGETLMIAVEPAKSSRCTVVRSTPAAR
jgi:hypothetical protein